MLKKIFVLLAMTAVIGITPVSAENNNAELLSRLGVYNGDATTYDTFINSVAGYLFENPESMGNAENIAKSAGMIDYESRYSGEEKLTVNEALKFAVVALGYKTTAESLGGYTQTAAQLGLTDGVAGNGSELLTEESAIAILYNMLDVEPMGRYYNGEYDQGYVIQKDETLLSANRNIYEVKGIMTANKITSIYGESFVAGEDCITIDEETYYCNSNAYDSLIGKNIIAYVKEISGEYEVLYVYEDTKKNDVVVVNRRDIEKIGSHFSEITYYENAVKEKTVKLSASPRVIYNGVLTVDYSEFDFIADNGTAEFIDTDRDGRYDVINITAYVTVVVESVDSTNLKIRNRYRFTDCLSEIDLYDSIGDKIYKIFDSKGNETDISTVRTDHVLSVAASKDWKVINVYISGNTPVQGSVERIDDYDDVLTVIGTKYKMSQDFKSFIADTSKVVKLGETYIFLIDYFGNIAYMKEEALNDYKLLLKVYMDRDSEEYYAVYMDMNGDWYTEKISDKVKIDEISYTSAQSAAKEIIDDEPQIVLLKKNSKKEINLIDRAIETADGTENEFCRRVEDKYTYRIEPKFFQMSTGGIVELENSAKVVVFPIQDIMNKENWSVHSATAFFTGNKQYNLTVYDIDEYRYTNLITIYETSELTSARVNNGLFIITGIEEKLIDGEVLPVIKGNIDSFIELDFTGKDSTVFEGCEIGDVVNLGFDSKGRVQTVVEVASLLNFAPKLGGWYSSNAFHMGTVTDIDLEKGRMLIDCGASLPVEITSAQMMTIFRADDKKCETGTAAELCRGDKVLLKMVYGS